MTITATIETKNKKISPEISWEILPDGFILPDDPVDNLTQPLLASVLREILEIAGLITSDMIIATNFGICTKVDGKTAVKAPDWVYIPHVNSQKSDRCSYTPYTEGDLPVIVIEFISETEGGEYSVNPHYPYGKWYFYEQILQIPVYLIFHPNEGLLECYRLENGRYQLQNSSDQGYYWLEEINLFLGVWQGQKADRSGYWLRWWNSEDNLLLWATERIDQQRQEKEQLLQQIAELTAKLNSDK